MEELHHRFEADLSTKEREIIELEIILTTKESELEELEKKVRETERVVSSLDEKDVCLQWQEMKQTLDNIKDELSMKDGELRNLIELKEIVKKKFEAEITS